MDKINRCLFHREQTIITLIRYKDRFNSLALNTWWTIHYHHMLWLALFHFSKRAKFHVFFFNVSFRSQNTFRLPKKFNLKPKIPIMVKPRLYWNLKAANSLKIAEKCQVLLQVWHKISKKNLPKKFFGRSRFKTYSCFLSRVNKWLLTVPALYESFSLQCWPGWCCVLSLAD